MRARCSDTAQGEEKAPGRQRAGHVWEQPTKVYWPQLELGSERCILFLSFVWETHAEFLLCILLQSIAPEEKTDTKERGKPSLF